MVASLSTMKDKPPYSGHLLSFEPRRTEKIDGQLHGIGEASESFSAMDWTFERREIVLLALIPEEPSICGAALMERMHGSGGTGKLKMRLSAPVFIDDVITATDLQNIVALADCVSTAERLKRIDVAIWPKLLDAIKRLRPSVADQIDALIAMRETERRLMVDGDRTLRLMEQRDAIGLVLDIANLDRHSILRALNGDKVAIADSVLDLLDHEPLQEQDIIRHDEQVFKGLLSQDMRHGKFAGLGGRQVRVHVYDKKPLETVLGIDLLIYQEGYKSFLLLQYKVMEKMRGGRGNTWSYLVDDQIHKQFTAMNMATSTIMSKPTTPSGLMDWRLNNSAFYFKFCEKTRPNARDDALVSGITLGLAHIEHFLTLPESKGEHGGHRIGYENCPRYFSNTQFVELAREGWIGCDQQGYALINDVIRASQQGGRSAMFAIVDGATATNARQRGRVRK